MFGKSLNSDRPLFINHKKLLKRTKNPHLPTDVENFINRKHTIDFVDIGVRIHIRSKALKQEFIRVRVVFCIFSARGLSHT